MKKKPTVFFESFEAQEDHRLLASINMSPAERLEAMYELNERLYGPRQEPLSRVIQIFVGKPGESVNGFYRRINGEN